MNAFGIIIYCSSSEVLPSLSVPRPLLEGLILGALTIIRLLLLKKLHSSGFTVIATMRDLKRKDKLLEAAGDAYEKTLSLAVLDVCSDESVKRCIDGIKDRHVDVLSESVTCLSGCSAKFSAQTRRCLLLLSSQQRGHRPGGPGGKHPHRGNEESV